MDSPFRCITDMIFVETDLEPADVILVPGGSHPQQMERAAALYHQGMAPWILPSGGSNPKLGELEWQYLRRIGLDLGVPEEAILKEDEAQNTFDNARNSWKVIEALDLKVMRVILVCKTQHARRALMTYQTVFPREIKFMVSPVMDNRQIGRDNWFLDEDKIKNVMKEVQKIGSYFGAHIPNWVNER
ncbi:hypothetical protein J31TS4_03790 [Paenibacillus sp. J31TS4]|uniref:YdcF family protein n=1 Tax=Paenibacillus sp. J31TS4 TaxID=2807195 RepID=UPI001B10F5DC|nr:YdcF family protein [Paenibacillus sp. J31TS4]GIP37099.1 hypothetical protein J31TS4_03790 [Paenibacillus sp. J31TS4]